MEQEQAKLNWIEKPWGAYAVIFCGDGHLVKILRVNAKAQLSLQSHKHRTERWTILSGRANVMLEGNLYQLAESDTLLIPAQAKHRLINPAGSPLQVLESSFGEIISEEDIVRHEDEYGR